MEAQEDFASPICEEDLPRSARLMSFFEAMMLVLLRQFATAMGGAAGSMGKMDRLWQNRKFKLHAKPSQLLSVEFHK
jgi:hypothetical protein